MKKVYLAASGDSRLPANQLCWPAQQEVESKVAACLVNLGYEVERLHPVDESKGHGFLDSQAAGLKAFAGADADAEVPIVVVEAVWQYSHHILPGLLNHKGPILTVANWSGQWPGLVGMLNLNGCLAKAGREFSTLWSESFSDTFFLNGLKEWADTGMIDHDLSHVRDWTPRDADSEIWAVADNLADDHLSTGAILAVFDEGCMGMYNAIIPDEMLFSMKFFKERLSQSALLHGMSLVSDDEAEAAYNWVEARGFDFRFGPDAEKDLTKEQVLEQMRMYIAAGRIAHSFGASALGIQYQLGLKDMCCASDLAEGLFNNSERPPIYAEDGSEILAGEPYPHFNEVDECAGIDALLTLWVHRELSQPVESTLHDLRWSDSDRSGTVDGDIWVFEISGAAPAAHHKGGYAGSYGERQASMYFPYGGSTLSGVAKPGEIIWSRIYVEFDQLNMDIGRAEVVDLPSEETQRRLDSTTPVWPIMHAKLKGVSRDQMMAKHKANHIQVAYANSAEEAEECMRTKAALAARLGMKVSFCGV